MSAELQSVVDYLDSVFAEFPMEDYPGAHNGLQVELSGDVRRIASAVDASEAAIVSAAKNPGTLLLVHHGLYWGGVQRLTGAWMRKVRTLVTGNAGVYSCHLPLDAHPEIGNNVLLARAMGLDEYERFLPHDGVDLGVKVRTNTDPATLERALANATGRPPRVVHAGPEIIRTVGIITGGAGGELERAARAGVDAFITGEAAHHVCVLAQELGVHLLLGGHYETETFGIRALGEQCAGHFQLPFEWIGRSPLAPP